MDKFFDSFDNIEIDWSKISNAELDNLISKLDKQQVEKVFGELQTCINTNNQRKSIINVIGKVLQTLVNLGMKI